MKTAMRVLLVNPHRTDPESAGVNEANFHRSRFDTPGKICSNTNLGLVSLATTLAKMGAEVEVLDLDGEAKPCDVLETVLTDISPHLIGFSCLFHTTYLSLADLAATSALTCPTAHIVAGGSHVAAVSEQALASIPHLDGVVVGEGESVIHLLIERPPSTWHEITGVRTRLGGKGTATSLDLEELDFASYPGLEKPIFVLEESRGCPFSCAFCWHWTPFRRKPLEIIKRELCRYLEVTPHEVPEVIVASDTLGLTKARLRGLLEILIASQGIRPFRWGSQTRSDCTAFTEASLQKLLSRSGLHSLSIGLESASPKTLLRMGKCKDPEKYLDSASDIVRNIGQVDGVNLRLNILLYAGETTETLQETRAFLEDHWPYYAGIHTSVVHAYPRTRLWKQLDDFAYKFGTTRVQGPYWNQVHAFPLNPSRKLDFQEAQQVATLWREEFTKVSSH